MDDNTEVIFPAEVKKLANRGILNILNLILIPDGQPINVLVSDGQPVKVLIPDG